MERQFEIMPDAMLFVEGPYKDKRRSIAVLPIVIWVEWPPVKEFGRGLTHCDCPIGFRAIDSHENWAAFAKAHMSPQGLGKNILCSCYGRLIE